jgi:hypothetical protein
MGQQAGGSLYTHALASVSMIDGPSCSNRLLMGHSLLRLLRFEGKRIGKSLGGRAGAIACGPIGLTH